VIGGNGLVGSNTEQFEDSPTFRRNMPAPTSGSKSEPRKERERERDNTMKICYGCACFVLVPFLAIRP
jgi:hypothetical protein